MTLSWQGRWSLGGRRPRPPTRRQIPSRAARCQPARRGPVPPDWVSSPMPPRRARPIIAPMPSLSRGLRTAIALAAAALAPHRPAAAQPPRAGWVAVFKHDGQGRPLAGDKRALIDAVRRGEDVRLAWGVRHPRDSTRSVEHTALGIFATVVDGAEVFVQVAEHVAHADYWARDAQAPGDPKVVWSAVLGTTGTFNAVMYDRASGAEVRRLPQRVTMTWFVRRPAAGARATPLYSPDPVS
jgi:hypothetical protein